MKPRLVEETSVQGSNMSNVAAFIFGVCSALALSAVVAAVVMSRASRPEKRPDAPP
jgi:hypothetical protein